MKLSSITRSSLHLGLHLNPGQSPDVPILVDTLVIVRGPQPELDPQIKHISYLRQEALHRHKIRKLQHRIVLVQLQVHQPDQRFHRRALLRVADNLNVMHVVPIYHYQGQLDNFVPVFVQILVALEAEDEPLDGLFLRKGSTQKEDFLGKVPNQEAQLHERRCDGTETGRMLVSVKYGNPF